MRNRHANPEQAPVEPIPVEPTEPEPDAVVEPACDAIHELRSQMGLDAPAALLLAGWLGSGLARVPAPILALFGHDAPSWATRLAELLDAEPHLLPATPTEVPNDAPNGLVYYTYTPTTPSDAVWNRLRLQAERKPVLIASVYPLENPLPFGSLLPVYLPLQPTFAPSWDAEPVRRALRAFAEYPAPDDAELPANDLPNPHWVRWCALRSQAFGANPAEFLDAYKAHLLHEFKAAAARDAILQRIRETVQRQGDCTISPQSIAAELQRFYSHATPRAALETCLRYAPAFAMWQFIVRYDGQRVHFTRSEGQVRSEYELQLERQWQLVRATLQADPDKLRTAETIWRLGKRYGFPELTLFGSRRVEAGAANYARYLAYGSQEGYLALLQQLSELASRPAAEATGEPAALEPVTV